MVGVIIPTRERIFAMSYQRHPVRNYSNTIKLPQNLSLPIVKMPKDVVKYLETSVLTSETKKEVRSMRDFLPSELKIIVNYDAFINILCRSGSKEYDLVSEHWCDLAKEIANEDLGYGLPKSIRKPITLNADMEGMSRAYEIHRLHMIGGSYITAPKSIVGKRRTYKRDLRMLEGKTPYERIVLSSYLAQIKGVSVVSPGIFMYMLNGEFIMSNKLVSLIMTSLVTSLRFKMPIEGVIIIGGSSTLLDYYDYITMSNLAINHAILNGYVAAEPIKAYKVIIDNITSNNDRVLYSKWISQSLMYLIDTLNDSVTTIMNKVRKDCLLETGSNLRYYRTVGSLSKEMIDKNLSFKETIGEGLVWQFFKIIKAMIILRNYEGGHVAAMISSLEKYKAVSFVDEDKSMVKYIERTCSKRVLNVDENVKLSLRAKKMIFKNGLKKGIISTRNVLHDGSRKGQINRGILLTYIVSPEASNLDDLLLDFFIGIRIVNILHLNESLANFSYIHDKACCKRSSQGWHDISTKELEEAMGRKDFGDIEQLSIRTDQGNPEISTNIDVLKERSLFKVKLDLKEKEQKEEGRLFGTGTLDMKMQVSAFNLAGRLVMELIDNQFMTISDEEKVQRTHEFGKAMQEKDTYSIMLDISGHNQSFMPETMDPLVRIINDAVEEIPKLNWEYLYRNLITIKKSTWGSGGTIIKGQYTGIEGWYAYLWGLHTTLAIEEFSDLAGIEMVGGSTYGDDINIIFKFRDNDTNKTDILIRLKEHFAKYGQEVKIDQTAISKRRFVMLKNTYIDGIPVDSSLKRMMRFSLTTDNVIYSDSYIMDNVMSIESSVYEKATYWYSCFGLTKLLEVLVATRALGFLISSRNSSRNRESDGEPMLDDGLLHKVEMRIHGDKHKYLEELTSGIEELKEIASSSDYRELYEENHIVKSYSDQTIKHIFTHGNKIVGLKDLLTILMYSPRAIGGYGIQPLIYTMCSGHSNATLRQFNFINTVVPRYAECLIKKLYNDVVAEPDEHKSLLANEFPAIKEVDTYNSILKRRVTSIISKNNRNIDISKAKSYLDGLPDDYDQIIRVNQGGFHFRLVSALVNHHHGEYFRRMVDKFASSSTIIGMDGSSTDYVRNSILSNNLTRLRNLAVNIISGDDTMNVQKELEARRQKTFPLVKILNFTEPDPLDIMSYVEKTSDIKSIIGTQSINDSGELLIAAPNRTSIVSEKFKGRSEMIKDSRTEALCRLFEQAKWIICNSLQVATPVDFEDTNVAQTVKIISFSWGHDPSQDDFLNARDPEGGEIYHRIKYKKGSPSVTCHLPFMLSGEILTIIGQSFIRKTKGENSNVNFALFKCVLGGVLMLNEIPFGNYKLIKPSNVVQVRTNFLHKSTALQSRKLKLDYRMLYEEARNALIRSILLSYSRENGRPYIKESELKDRLTEYKQLLYNMDLTESSIIEEVKKSIDRIILYVDKKRIHEAVRLSTDIALFNKKVEPSVDNIELVLMSLISRLTREVSVSMITDGILNTLSRVKQNNYDMGGSESISTKDNIINRLYTSKLIDWIVSNLTTETENDISQDRYVQRITQYHEFEEMYKFKNVFYTTQPDIIERTSAICKTVSTRLTNELLNYLETTKAVGRVFDRINETLILDSTRSSTIEEFQVLLLSANNQLKMRSEGRGNSGLVELTGGRGGIANVYQSMRENGELEHISTLFMCSRRDGFSNIFKCQYAEYTNFDLSDAEYMKKVALVADVFIFEFSYISNLKKVIKNLADHLSDKTIVISPGNKLSSLMRESALKESIVQVEKWEIGRKELHLLIINPTTRPTNQSIEDIFITKGGGDISLILNPKSELLIFEGISWTIKIGSMYLLSLWLPIIRNNIKAQNFDSEGKFIVPKRAQLKDEFQFRVCSAFSGYTKASLMTLESLRSSVQYRATEVSITSQYIKKSNPDAWVALVLRTIHRRSKEYSKILNSVISEAHVEPCSVATSNTYNTLILVLLAYYKYRCKGRNRSEKLKNEMRIPVLRYKKAVEDRLKDLEPKPPITKLGEGLVNDSNGACEEVGESDTDSESFDLKLGLFEEMPEDKFFDNPIDNMRVANIIQDDLILERMISQGEEGGGECVLGGFDIDWEIGSDEIGFIDQD